MRNSLMQRRIPTLLGFFLVGIGLVVSSWFLQRGVLFPTQAANGSTPQHVRISNVTDTSFTLSYTTSDAVIGAVSYGESNTDEKRATDDRDMNGTPSQYTTHSITLSGLSPGKTYQYKILSGDKEYMKDNAPFSFTLPDTLENSEDQQFVVSGRVQLPDVTSVLVYATLPDSQVLSTLTSPDGSFSLSSDQLRSANFSDLVSYQDSTPVTLLLTNGSLSSKVLTSVGSSSSLPPVSLSQNYDFSQSSDPIGEFSASDSADLAGFPSVEVDDDEESTVTAEILTPDANEGFTDPRPQFSGRALPNSEVEIIIHSEEEIKASVKANTRGTWTYRPTAPLSPGEHTLTVRTRDEFGILQELTQSFVVYAEGSQFTDPSVSPVRTPSPTRTPSPSPSPTGTTPSPTTGVTITITPTASPSPTLTITTPTPSPTLIVVVPSITPVEPPPDAGSPAFVLSAIVGVVTLSVGLVVLFMSKGGAL
jgi:hypothetical protein